jgi:hypothetical protein
MAVTYNVVDADRHVLEPFSLWEEYRGRHGVLRPALTKGLDKPSRRCTPPADFTVARTGLDDVAGLRELHGGAPRVGSAATTSNA